MSRRAVETMASLVDTASNRDGEICWLIAIETFEDVDNG